MQHPVFGNKNATLTYLLIGIVFIIIDFLLIHYSYKCSLSIAVINAFVYDATILILGGSLWFPVYFHDRNKGSLYSILQLLLVGVIFIGIWVLSSYFFVYFIDYVFSIAAILPNDFFLIRILIGILIYLLFISVYFLMKGFQNEEEHNREKLVLKNLLSDTELNLLKSQLNPHFLFNSLNSISSLTIYDAEGARDMITKLSDFLRYSLRNNEQKLLSFREELDNLRKYMEIERIRFGDKINFIEDIKKECFEKDLPALIIQPLMENAIKHGVYNSISNTDIKLQCNVINGDLIISLLNDYETDVTGNKGEGVGLANTRKRLQIIYGNKDLVKIEKTESEFFIELTIPQFINQ